MTRRYTLGAMLLALVLSPLASAQILFRADLTGAQEVPPVTTTASGLATAVLDGSTLILRGSFEGLESDYNPSIGSHLHLAPAGQNGPVVFVLDPALTEDRRGGTWFGPENRFANITPDQAQALRDGTLYVNVHTIDNPSGELRGQLTPTITLNEVRSDQPSTDVDEYVELAGPAGASLNGYSFVVIGDGSAGIGVIEEIIDLSGQTIPDDGYFLFGELTLATPDLEVNVNLENGDGVTYLLVEGVPGTEGDDLDTDDDGVLDITPWNTVADAIGAAGADPADAIYGTQLGFEDLGLDGSSRADHLFRNRDDGVWRIGTFDGFARDTPGEVNASTAFVQIVHNAPDSGAKMVDVYIDGGLAVDDLAFQTATPFVLLDAGVELELTVAEMDSDDPEEDGVFDTAVTLDGSRGYYVVATGLLGDNGDDFRLAVYDNARRFSTTPGTVDVGFFHGTPDAPPVDIRTQGVAQAILFNDVPFGAFGAETYQPAGAVEFNLEVSDAGGTPLAVFTADLSGLDDQSALLLASGFFNEASGDADFALLAVRPDGSTAAFAVPSEGPAQAREVNLLVANPVRQSAEVRFETPTPGATSLRVYDALGRRVATLANADLPSGDHTATWDAIALAPGVYILRLDTEAGTVSRVVTVVR
ncbi:MAG: CHRD domain-containing protein [Bacteroidota bacterium]